MKKIISLIIIILLSGTALSQVKVRFSLANPSINDGKLIYDLKATVPAQQVWRVGPTNIRLGFISEPENAFKIIQDNPATNANLNIHNNSNYGNITTTSIHDSTAVSFNILKLFQGPTYRLTEGSYTLGSIRWLMLDSNGCIELSFFNYSAIFDSLSALNFGQHWNKTDTTWCNPIGINMQLITETPTSFRLHQNYPNPFNPSTKIKYDLPKSSHVRLDIFDAAGRHVETAVEDDLGAGSYEFLWNSASYSTGVYFYTLVVTGNTSEVYKETKKMILLK